MCFVSKNRKAYVAKKDITCYKVMVKSTLHDSVWRSPYRYFGYVPYKVYQTILNPFTRIPVPSLPAHIVLHEGFHSYSKRETVKLPLYTVSVGVVVVKCIIPKGATYYKNTKQGIYVSNQIKIIKEIS